MNGYRINVAAAIILAAAAAATTAWAAAGSTVEEMALADFAARDTSMLRSAAQIPAALQLSEVSLPLHELQNGTVVMQAQTLRFILREETVEGLVVMTAAKPLRFAGKNRATDLAQLYQLALARNAGTEAVCYLELDGQGAFAVRNNGETVVYLSRSAAEWLQLPERKALSMAQVRQAYEKRK